MIALKKILPFSEKCAKFNSNGKEKKNKEDKICYFRPDNYINETQLKLQCNSY